MNLQPHSIQKLNEEAYAKLDWFEIALLLTKRESTYLLIKYLNLKTTWALN
jgi:hypothetical protein